MLGAIALLLTCQLTGEIVHRMLGLPLPGSIIGMLLLIAWLAVKRKERTALESVSTWLTAHLSILLVPGAVGLIDQGPILRREGIGLLVAIVVSTLLTMMVTVLVFQWVVRRMEKQSAGES